LAEERFKVEIECGEETSSSDVADSLERVVEEMRVGAAKGHVRDHDGTIVGHFGFE
jgi:hypothetical protein